MTDTSALEKMIAENRWRPIEEAPKDGSQFLALLRHKNIGRVYIHEHEVPTKIGVLCWSTHPLYPVWIGTDTSQWEPTHFRPLPDDQLADVCELLLTGLDEVMEKEILEKANTIAAGGSNDTAA